MTDSNGHSDTQPNVVLILADDMGFSDLGCYGGEIRTPQLDALAGGGVRFTQFYNTARCSPSRASLLTGLHPHTTDVGILAKDDRPGGYPGSLNQAGPTAAEVFRDAGYRTGMSGKWHLSANVHEADGSWPTRRGFGHFFGTISGCGSYYQPGTLMRGESPVPAEETAGPDWFYTDAIADDAIAFLQEGDPTQPFLLYMAFTAPHWPLHAPEEDVRAYDGHYDQGWDEARRQRLQRQHDQGIIEPHVGLTDRDPHQPAWESVADVEWQKRRMQVYAAQVERMDRSIGRVLAALDDQGTRDNTIVVFLSDNGGCAEELPFGDPDEFRERADIFNKSTRDGHEVQLGNYPTITPGPEHTYASYGQGWANVSNTPFRLYKRWVHEGGIATPLIINWPNGGLQVGSISRDPYQLTDMLPTLIDLTRVAAPTTETALPGVSAQPSLTGGSGVDHDLFWEHIGNAAIRRGNMKLVKETHGDWELYDLAIDRGEGHDLSNDQPELVRDLADRWQAWADQVGVLPWEVTLKVYADRGLGELEANS